jgi:hypothetical protein
MQFQMLYRLSSRIYLLFIYKWNSNSTLPVESYFVLFSEIFNVDSLTNVSFQ